MRKRRLFVQLFLPIILVTVAALAVFAWLAVRALHDLNVQQMTADLQSRTALAMQRVRPLLEERRDDDLQRLVSEMGAAAVTRFTVILPDGTVIGDSMEDPSNMDNHADRPEIIDARESGVGSAERFSFTIQRNSLSVARKISGNAGVLGYVRASVPMTWIEQSEQTLMVNILIGGLVIAVAACIVVVLTIRRLVRPIRDMREGAARFARGEFDTRLPVEDSLELGSLAESLNDMASQLDQRIRTILEQHREQEAMLASMIEGVLAVDSEERIINVNRALAVMFQLDPASSNGRSIQEVIRNTDLQRFAARALDSAEPIEGFISVHGIDDDMTLQAHGTVLRNARGHHVGAVIVLNDVTRLRRLENMRREFVSNVSHELKTPVTSIKGFVETLLDGALDSRADAERFLHIIARQADRLNSIIDDLLALSRIEQEAEREEIVLESGPVRDVLRSAVLICEAQAREKRMQIRMECEEGLQLRMNPHLLEQAVINLIHNAIKYGDEAGEILVRAERTREGIRIDVRDSGIGIAPEHLPRLFERFYRVDKARSRSQGGTGLGLAIVKHIAQAHGGTVGVVSAPGQGSTFSIIIPEKETH